MSNPLDDSGLSASLQTISLNLPTIVRDEDENDSEFAPPQLTISEEPDSPPFKRDGGTLPKSGSQSPFAGLKLLMPKLAVDSTSTPVSSPANPNMTKCPLDERFSSSLSSSLLLINRDFGDDDDNEDDNNSAGSSGSQSDDEYHDGLDLPPGESDFSTPVLTRNVSNLEEENASSLDFPLQSDNREDGGSRENKEETNAEERLGNEDGGEQNANSDLHIENY